ncbi:MAG: thermonuclease family protein [Alphaproteobacteria bacterium]|nr:thermonuclease family protein [Alphaproteobacteria bacterium]
MRRGIKIILSCGLILAASEATAAIQVVDGDSLADGDMRIRLEGIDAPEFTQMCEDENKQEYACGQAASDHLRQLIEGIEPDCRCENKDKYNRLLCECFIGEMSLNRQMVADGWAMQYRSERFNAEEERATAERKGLWQGKFMRPALHRVLERLRLAGKIR